MSRSQESLRIYYCGHEVCEPGHAFGPATRSHYLMHFIIKGKGYYQVGNDTLTIKENEAFLIKPHEVTFYRADIKEPWEYVWIAFDGVEAERLLDEYKSSKGQYIYRWEEQNAVKDYLMKILHIYMKTGYNKDELLGMFYLVFSQIMKEGKEERPADLDYFQKAERYIRHNYGYDVNITDIAKYIGIDRTYLFKIFKKYTTKSPKQYLTMYRISAAKDMLRNTNLRVTEIALSCGFYDSSIFCKNFEREVGISPLKFRRGLISDSKNDE